MKIFLITNPNTTEYSYGEFREIVVAAENETDAKEIKPDKHGIYGNWSDDKWLKDKESFIIKYLGEAAPGIESSVICADSIEDY